MVLAKLKFNFQT